MSTRILGATYYDELQTKHPHLAKLYCDLVSKIIRLEPKENYLLIANIARCYEDINEYLEKKYGEYREDKDVPFSIYFKLSYAHLVLLFNMDTEGLSKTFSRINNLKNTYYSNKPKKGEIEH